MVLSRTIKNNLDRITLSPVLWDAPMQGWTSFRIGGPADALVTPESVVELQAVLALCAEEKIDWRIIGRGTNLLVPDDGYRGVIIVLGDGFKTITRNDDAEIPGVVVRTGCATALSRLADWNGEQGLSGLEFTAGIPGSVGGAVAGNAGAWGTEIGDVVSRLHLVDAKETKILTSQQLKFGYRYLENLKALRGGWVIIEVEFLLQNDTSEKIRQTMRTYRNARREKQPVGMPSAGSFFKNPEGDSAGRLIDSAGLKGLSVGDAEVSLKHANFLVNRGNARAADVIALMKDIQSRVKQNSGILLEPEVHFL